MAADPAVVGAIDAHDRLRRSTDLPLYYGRKDKDTITPHLLIERVERAAQIANWDTDARKCAEFNLILRDRAIQWWKSLKVTTPDFNLENWNAVKQKFLEVYEPRYTARTTCISFQELFQKSTENVSDFYFRAVETLQKMTEVKPPHLTNVRHPYAAITAVQNATLKRQGLEDMERFFLQQLFTAGIREDLRIKVMEAGLDNLEDTVKLARELEVIHNDRKHNRTNISAVENFQVPENEEEQEKLIEAINAMRSKKGSSGTFAKKKRGPCWYCKGPNHAQLECRKRKAAKAPMVNKDGTPMKVHSVQDEAAQSAQAQTDNGNKNPDPNDYYGMSSCNTIQSLNY